MWELVFVCFILFIGSCIQGTSGFGFGLFSMGLLPILLSLKDSTLLVLALTVILSLNIAIKFKEYIRIKDLIYIVVSALGGRVLSFFFLNSYGEMDSMKKLLGVILIGIVLYLYFSEKNTYSPSFSKPIYPVVIGFFGGLIGGIFAVGGPILVFYFLIRYSDKNSYNANLQASFFIMNFFTIILHGVNGDFNESLYLYLFFGVFFVLFGVKLGLMWFERLPRELIKKFASFIVLIAGLNLLFFS